MGISDNGFPVGSPTHFLYLKFHAKDALEGNYKPAAHFVNGDRLLRMRWADAQPRARAVESEWYEDEYEKQEYDDLMRFEGAMLSLERAKREFRIAQQLLDQFDA